MNEPQPVPPGWYPAGDSERYWDGSAWTSSVRAPADPPERWAPPDSHGLPHQPPAPGYGQPGPAPVPAPGPPQGSPRGPTPGASWPHQPAYGTPPPPGYAYVAPKSPGVSVLASFFLPGLGSMINGDIGKGVAILLGWFVSWLLVIVLVGIFGVFGFWVWGMVDAYRGARAWNARHGIIS